MRYLNSLGVSRLHIATRTVKIEQLKSDLSWRQSKAKLRDLRRTGILTLSNTARNPTKNRVILQWEPRVFPEEEIKPEAQRTLEVVKHDLTLAFKTQQDREEFMDWFTRSGLLTQG